MVTKFVELYVRVISVCCCVLLLLRWFLLHYETTWMSMEISCDTEMFWKDCCRIPGCIVLKQALRCLCEWVGVCALSRCNCVHCFPRSVLYWSEMFMRKFPSLCPVFLPSNMSHIFVPLSARPPVSRAPCALCLFYPPPIVPNYRLTHRRLFVITFRENKGNLASGSCIHLNSEPKCSQSFLTMIHYRDQASILEELSVHEFQFNSMWISDEENEVQQSLANQM